jgi:hypothetical protein
MKSVFFAILCLFQFEVFTQDFETWSAQIKEDFDKENLVLQNKEVTVSFKKNSKTSKPEAIITHKYDFVSLKASEVNELFVIYYNDQIEINEIKLNGKKVSDYKTSKHDYNDEGIFHSDSKLSTFNMNFIKQGTPVSVEYSTTIKDIKYIGQYYFHDDYGTYKSQTTVIIPDWIDVRVEELNFEKFKVDKKSTIDKENNSVLIYGATQLDPWHNEDATDGPTYIYPHILLLPKHYTHENKEYKLFETVSDLYEWYNSLINAVFNDNEDLIPLVEKLMEGKTTDKEKIESIYYWVQDNIRYIAFEDGIAGFKPEACHKVYQHKYGDCKGMANLTAEMLKIAGFDARLTWLGTRRIAYDYSYPSLSTDNHMICTIFLNDEIFYLDPTEKFTALGEDATRIQEQEVLIQDGDNYILNRIPMRHYTLNKLNFKSNLTLNSNNQLIGNADYLATGECKTYFFNMINQIELNELDKFMKGYLGGFNKNNNIFNLTINNKEDRNKPLDVNYEITIDNAVTSYGKELYIQIDPYKDYISGKIDEDRKFDYLHDIRKVEASQIQLEVPSGYSVKYLPESLDIQNDEFNLKISFTQEGNQIKYDKEINFPSIKISKTNFDQWNKAVKALKDIYNDQIILERQ